MSSVEQDTSEAPRRPIFLVKGGYDEAFWDVAVADLYHEWMEDIRHDDDVETEMDDDGFAVRHREMVYDLAMALRRLWEIDRLIDGPPLGRKLWLVLRKQFLHVLARMWGGSQPADVGFFERLVPDQLGMGRGESANDAFFDDLMDQLFLSGVRPPHPEDYDRPILNQEAWRLIGDLSDEVERKQREAAAKTQARMMTIFGLDPPRFDPEAWRLAVYDVCNPVGEPNPEDLIDQLFHYSDSINDQIHRDSVQLEIARRCLRMLHRLWSNPGDREHGELLESVAWQWLRYQAVIQISNGTVDPFDGDNWTRDELRGDTAIRVRSQIPMRPLDRQQQLEQFHHQSEWDQTEIDHVSRGLADALDEVAGLVAGLFATQAPVAIWPPIVRLEGLVDQLIASRTVPENQPSTVPPYRSHRPISERRKVVRRRPGQIAPLVASQPRAELAPETMAPARVITPTAPAAPKKLRQSRQGLTPSTYQRYYWEQVDRLSIKDSRRIEGPTLEEFSEFLALKGEQKSVKGIYNFRKDHRDDGGRLLKWPPPHPSEELLEP